MKPPVYLFVMTGIAAAMAIWVVPNYFNVHGYIFLMVLGYGVVSALVGAKIVKATSLSVKTAIILVAVSQVILAVLAKIALPVL